MSGNKYDPTVMPRNVAYGLAGAEFVAPRREDIRERFVRRRREYEQQIAAIDKGLALLDRNPDIEELLGILGTAGY